ncbi:MAG: hypothetical protein FWE13_02620 [Firmicutes bacterium]|nr:hypothetical protein [Bacillota bacterium]
MTKYDGVHKPIEVDVELSNSLKNIEPHAKNVFIKNFLIRCAIAVVALGMIFGISRANFSFSYAFSNGIRQAITMEFFSSPSIVDRDDFLIDLLRPSDIYAE